MALAQMLLVRRLSPQALGVPDACVPKPLDGRGPYHETSSALGEMALCLTPQVSAADLSACISSSTLLYLIYTS